MANDVEDEARSFVDKYYQVLNNDASLITGLYHSSATRNFLNVEENAASVLFHDHSVGRFEPDDKAEVDDICVEPLKGDLLVVVKGVSGGYHFSQSLYLTRENLCWVIYKEIICFLSHRQVSQSAEPHLSEADRADLKEKIKAFADSLMKHPEVYFQTFLSQFAVTGVKPKINDGRCLRPRINQPIVGDASVGPKTMKTVNRTKACEPSNCHQITVSPSVLAEKYKVCIITHAGMHDHRSKTNKRETPRRARHIINKLQADGLFVRCDKLTSEKAGLDHVTAVHDSKYVALIPNAPLTPSEKETYEDYFGDDVYFSKGSRDASFLAAGSVVQGCRLVAEGHYDAAFAIVRPPGHHAMPSKASGFCILNNLAIGAKYLLNKGYKKILIFDFDIHHGDGTQRIFYDDCQVMVISVHSEFVGFPFDKAEPLNRSNGCIGEGGGIGYNINISLEKTYGDADMFYVMQNIVLPLAAVFMPDFILVSAGYDALEGDDLQGGALLTPKCLATVVHMLKKVNTGRLVLSLEGGYNVDNTAEGVACTVRALLGDKDVLIEEHDFYKKDLLPGTAARVDEVKELHNALLK